MYKIKNLAIVWILIAWCVTFHYVNEAVSKAGHSAGIPYLVVGESLLVAAYICGIVLMLVGIGRDVTLKGILTFNMREFKPETNWLYRLGFWLNRLGAFACLYILIGSFVVGRLLPTWIALLCLADTTGTAWVSFNLTHWIKKYGHRP